MTVAVLFADPQGIYRNLPGIDLWPESRDARNYHGPWPVIAHPPCARWGKYWFGSPLNPIHRKGDDGGCFSSALVSVRRHGGVLEHPAYSHAWKFHGLPHPVSEGWQRDINGGWCCQVDQQFYGHYTSKPTWLYAVNCELPELEWKRGKVIPDAAAVARHGMKKARRIGGLAWRGGGGNTAVRAATPEQFRDLLLAMVGYDGRPDGYSTPPRATKTSTSR